MSNVKETVSLLLGCLLLFSGTIPIAYVQNLSRSMGIGQFLQSRDIVFQCFVFWFIGACLLMFGMSVVFTSFSMRLQRKSLRSFIKNQGVV